MRVCRPKSGGFAAVVVLCFVVLLSILLTLFAQRVLRSIRSADDFEHVLHAENCALSGLEIALATLEKGHDMQEQVDEYSANTAQQPVTALPEEIQLDGGTCRLSAVSENGKLNVNALVGESGKMDDAAAARMFRLIEQLNAKGENIALNIVPTIVDWIDTDDSVTGINVNGQSGEGAESCYYLSLQPPYRAKNEKLELVSELLQLRGVTDRTLATLSDYVTVHGDAGIDINSAPPEVICCLSDAITPAVAGEVIARRELKPFRAIYELKQVPGITDKVYESIKDVLTVDPQVQFYYVTSTGAADRQRRTILAMVRLDKTRKPAGAEVIRYEELGR